jgi:hypothetical protein
MSSAMACGEEIAGAVPCKVGVILHIYGSVRSSEVVLNDLLRGEARVDGFVHRGHGDACVRVGGKISHTALPVSGLAFVMLRSGRTRIDTQHGVVVLDSIRYDGGRGEHPFESDI